MKHFSKERKHDSSKSKRRSRSRSKDRFKNSKSHAKEHTKDKVTTPKDEEKKEMKVEDEIFDPTNRDKVSKNILRCFSYHLNGFAAKDPATIRALHAASRKHNLYYVLVAP